MSPPRMSLDQAALVVVDLQQKLLPVIHAPDAVVGQVAKLIRGCVALGVPMIVTEQYPQGLGPTVEAIRAVLPARTPTVSKVKFSACVEDVRRWLAESGRRTVLLAGIESHVCVMQTALDLLESGYVVAVVADAIGSRRTTDHEIGLRRMMQAGVVPVSVEMALLELVHEAGTTRFKAILPVIK